MTSFGEVGKAKKMLSLEKQLKKKKKTCEIQLTIYMFIRNILVLGVCI